MHIAGRIWLFAVIHLPLVYIYHWKLFCYSPYDWHKIQFDQGETQTKYQQKMVKAGCEFGALFHWLTLNVKSITKTYLYNFDPIKPHFYIVKLGFTGVYIIVHIYA